MADTYGNTAATSPKDQYINSQFYKPPTPVAGYDPSTVFDSSGKGLSHDQYIAAGGKSDYSNVLNTDIPTQTSTNTPSAVSTARNSYLDTFTPSSALDSARQAYLTSLSPDSNLSSAQKKYNDFVVNEKLGENALEGQGRGIPLQVIRGEQGKLAAQSELEAKRLQGDVGIAEQASQSTQNRAKAGLDFATTDATTAQNKAQASLGFATDDQTANKATEDFNIKNKIIQPYYYSGNQIVDAATGQAKYKNVGGEIQSLDGSKRYGSQTDFFKDAGIKSWDQIQKNVGSDPLDKLLSPTEAKALGVPYGTTQKQAAGLGITPTTKKPGTGSPTPSTTSAQLIDAFKTGWASEGYIQGNGKISSQDYKEAKKAFKDSGVKGSTGAAFDAAMKSLIDTSGSNWQADYGYGT